MDYRGPDLDLRTSRWSAASTDPSSWREANAAPAPQPAPVPAARQPGQRSSPIWVDETLLACANHAYDVALAYRSAEVRLEHLLLAMTRVEPAAVALEARGVRVASLRRDCAVAIAGDPPAPGAEGASPRRSPELEDVLRLAASRAAHSGRAAGVDDMVQALGEVGGDLPGADLVVRHFPRSRDFWGSLGASRSDGDRPLTISGAPMQSPGVDQAVVQRLFERLSDMERGFADRLAALEAALATERSERASAITALSDEISGVRSAVRLAAQNSEAAQSALTEQLQQIAATLDQQRFDLGGGAGDRVAAIEQALEAQSQRLAEAQAVYSAELAEVHEALMKIGANHQTLAGAIDNWRSNDSGEIHLINARIGAVHEDGSKRLAAIEKLCADVETLSHLVLDDRARQQGSFKRWLLGTEDWVKASWRPPAIPRPRLSRPKWTRLSWRLPLSKRRTGTSTNG